MIGVFLAFYASPSISESTIVKRDRYLKIYRRILLYWKDKRYVKERERIERRARAREGEVEKKIPDYSANLQTHMVAIYIASNNIMQKVNCQVAIIMRLS